MSHMVMFRTAEGKPGYHQTESLDEAIRFVEHLRNQEQVADTRVFRMQEVPIEVKTYYKVEVSPSPAPAPGPVSSTAAPSPATPSASATPTATSVVPATTKAAKVPAEEPIVVEPMAPANGMAGPKFGRFNRS